MLARGNAVLLGGQHLQSTNQAKTSLGRLDDVIHISFLGSDRDWKRSPDIHLHDLSELAWDRGYPSPLCGRSLPRLPWGTHHGNFSGWPSIHHVGSHVTAIHHTIGSAIAFLTITVILGTVASAKAKSNF